MSALVGEGVLRFTPIGQRMAARVGPAPIRLVSLPLLLATEYALCVHVLPPPPRRYRSDAAMAASAALIPDKNPFTGKPFERSPHAAHTAYTTATPAAAVPATTSAPVSTLLPLPPLQPAVPSWAYAAASGLAVAPFAELVLALTGLRKHPRVQAALPFLKRRVPVYAASTALTTALTYAWEQSASDAAKQPQRAQR